MVQTYKKSHENMCYEEIYKEKSVNEEYNLNNYIKSQRDNIWSGMSPELFTLFWALEPKQLSVPKETYQAQIETMQTEIKRLEAEKALEGKNKFEKDIDKIRRNIDILKQEMNLQLKEKEKMDIFLQANKEKIVSVYNEVKKRPLDFLQYCL